ncbi:hypothetical protein GCM10010289_72350 [Streptomyces violascens]|nr:hypothetical protein GCM10010289_72350 [Streptomyces violascens]
MAMFLKPDAPEFSVDVLQNEYLPEGGREVHAIVTVTATGGDTNGRSVTGPHPHSAGLEQGVAVAIMVDCSGSMDYPPAKMCGVREATAAAIDTVRDGAHFAVVGGTDQATEVYPGGGKLAVANTRTRQEARWALRKLSAGGGTAIGTWLRLADQLLHSADVGIRHGILLTDGRNEHESPEDLQAALDACSGRFTCDVRGVGTDWEVKEVTGIASALLGSADIVADPARLVDDFTQLMEKAMRKEIAEVALRLWTPIGAEITFVKQVAPTVEELTGRRAPAGPRAGDYPTGAWGEESRDYHICVRVPAADVGQEMLAARISVVVPQPDGNPLILSQGLVRVVWTDDMAAFTSINPQVAHYSGQTELAVAIQEGLDARKAGDHDRATVKLGRAVQLAVASGNVDTAKLLAKVVVVVDAATGTVRLRTEVADADEMALEARSTKTVRVAPRSGALGNYDTTKVLGPEGNGPDRPRHGGGDRHGWEPRLLEAQLVEQAPPGREIPLHVRITREAGGSVVALRAFHIPPAGAQLRITVHAPGLLALGDLQQGLTVPPGRDSDWLQFGLRTMKPGLHTVTVRAFHRGTFLGELRAQVSVQPDTPARDGSPRTAPLATLAFDPGEVTLQVLKGADGTYSFQLLSETTYAPESFRLVAGDSHGARERIYDELRRTAAAAGQNGGRDQGQARRRLINLGVQLWATAVPDAVRQQFWEEAGHVASLTVLGEHDVVPWELLYPLDGQREGDGFLAEWLPVVRRVFGQDRVRELSLPRAAFVVPPGSPPEAEREVVALRARLGDTVTDGGTLTHRAAVSDLIDEGLNGLLHFACHNSFTSAGSHVTMADGPFDPIDLAYATQSRALRTTHPLVFFNACRSAGQIDWFSTSLGWAPQFLQAGAGAFVGTLWPVRSDSALLFADTFYERLVADGQSLGQASLNARRAIRDHGGDPTWLAYAVYGSPAACAATP